MRNRNALIAVALALVVILVLPSNGLLVLSLGAVTSESVCTLAEARPAAPAAAAAPSESAADVLDALQSTLQQIYDDVNPSVVNIQVVQRPGFAAPGLPENPDSPFGSSLPDGFPSPQGEGSSFVWDSQGNIVTNNHVVDGAEKISVTFYDNRTLPAELVGTDPHSDVAVIKVAVAPDQLQPVKVADSTQVRVGQLAMAIGNPLDSLTQIDVCLPVCAV